MSITIIKPGLLATIQDLGRSGYGKYGVIVSGSMDRFAHRTANWLVGNDEGDAVIEVTWSGMSLRLEREMWIALTGGDFSPQIDGIPVPMWRPVFVRKGSILAFTGPKNGCRTYMAVAGGIGVPEVLGSRSTYIRAGIGGMKGRALKSGDIIPVGDGKNRLRHPSLSGTQAFDAVRWAVPASARPAYSEHPLIRLIRGPQFGDFDEVSRHALLHGAFRITPQSDRMGYRLEGPKLQLQRPQEYISEGVTMGTVQVPPDGQPIILMADRQTLGGYPKIAQVAGVDLPVIAQTRPGSTLRFREIGQAEAEQLWMDQGIRLNRLARMIDLRLKEDGCLDGLD
ncbi:biotin-dependent carboxyltransferase family protein [Paenibacillus sp. XY044]|uniref:5-oxoprolinase subunit C family protein n=1 Tax=Paenibacillus sp. XY044 TaxID=2026089 RepID=UPI000B98F116|nr:biotin-dependent carboxyltransferase family protein [Paenibacillus sp. XY044]OZB98392.1 urea amidolyase [Paenibacillus sp. XY044]